MLLDLRVVSNVIFFNTPSSSNEKNLKLLEINGLTINTPVVIAIYIVNYLHDCFILLFNGCLVVIMSLHSWFASVVAYVFLG